MDKVKLNFLGGRSKDEIARELAVTIDYMESEGMPVSNPDHVILVMLGIRYAREHGEAIRH